MNKRLSIFKLTITSVFLGAFLSFAPNVFASTLTLSPGSVTTAPGQTFTVTVRLNASGDNVNAVSAYLNYPANLVDAVSINDSSSAFSIKAAGDIGGGQVKISRGNFSGLSGNLSVASITFRGKAVGKGSISFAGGSKAPRTSDHSDSLDLSKSGAAAINVVASLPKASGSPVSTAAKPQISGLDFTNVASNSATVVWKTDVLADSEVEFGTDGTTYFANTSNAKLVTDHSVALVSPLFSAGQIFHVRVISKDAKGNASTSDDKLLHFKGAAMKVKVTDVNNVPVNNAQIYLFSDPLQTFTNQNGDAYYGDVVPGKHTLLVKFGTYEKSNDITVANSGEVQTFGIKMPISIAQATGQGISKTQIYTIAGVVLALIIVAAIVVIIIIRRRSGGGGPKPAATVESHPVASPPFTAPPPQDTTAAPTPNPVIYQ